MNKLKELGLQDLYIDLNSKIMGTLYAKEGEVNSRGLRIFIMNNGQRFDSTGLDVSFYGRTKDNKVYQVVATEISTVNGMYEIIYPSNMLMAGDVVAELRLSKEDGSNIATKNFVISIDERIITEDLIEGVNEPDLIDKLLQAAVNENNRISNELVREENEGDRINLYNEIKDKLNAGEFNGADGQPGKDGKDGADGLDGYTPVKGIDYFDGEDGQPGADGQPGKDGADGQDGQPGQPGQDGQDGKSAYQIWLDEGNEGTEQDFLESLEGEDGSSLGSFSSNENIEYYSNAESNQVNVSKDSHAGGFGWLINVGAEPDEVWLAVDMYYIEGDWETDYLVDGAFVYANVHHLIEDEYVMDIAPQVTGEMYGLELYPVKWGHVSGYLTQVNASDYSYASGNNSQVNASDYSYASGNNSQVNASHSSTASGYQSQVSASMNSTTIGDVSQVNASIESIASGVSSQVNASQGVLNDTGYSSAWGFGSYGTDPSTQNIKIHLLSESGDINHSGVLNSGHNFTDFAELFPNLTGEAQGYGLIQTIDGHGVRPADSGDQVVGVTSATAGVVLGETPFSWQDRWLKDEWGAFIIEDVVDEDWEPREWQTEEDRPVHRLPKENPEYDPEREYAKRQERPDEWTVVGLVGQVYVRLDENVEPMDYVKPLKDGVGQTSSEPTNIRVMKITQEFDKDKGYKIGFCLLK